MRGYIILLHILVIKTNTVYSPDVVQREHSYIFTLKLGANKTNGNRIEEIKNKECSVSTMNRYIFYLFHSVKGAVCKIVHLL